MNLRDLARMFMETYSQRLRVFVDRGRMEPWSATEAATYAVLVYRLKPSDVGLKISFDMIAGRVGWFVVDLSDMKKPDIDANSQERPVRLYLWQILEALATILPQLRDQLGDWQYREQLAYTPIWQYLQSRQKPEHIPVVDYLRTDSEILYSILDNYIDDILAYSLGKFDAFWVTTSASINPIQSI